MPSLAARLPAYYDTLDRTKRSQTQSKLPKQVDPTWLGIANSQALTHNETIENLRAAISNLSILEDNWNGYGSPRPSMEAIRSAESIVFRFMSLNVLPEKVTASADGGVALILVGVENHRAVIECFGTTEDYVLLYDTAGNSRSLQWPQNDEAKDKVLGELQSYLRGHQVAPLG